MIRILDFVDGRVVPSEHCYTLATLRAIMETFPEEPVKMDVYSYVHYMTCPNPDLNPYFNVAEEEKEQAILKELKNLNVSLEHPVIIAAIAFCNDLYDTPTVRMYRGLKTMLDRMAVYLENTPVTHGRDGNINSLLRAGKEFGAIRKSYKEVYNDLLEEQKNMARGGMAYDSRH